VNPFRSLRDYEEFIYTLPQHYPTILSSTLVVVRRSALQATVSGELTFADDYTLIIRELLTAEYGVLLVQRYSYEAWRRTDILYWYDSQPHPHDPARH
jgi:hypothetical protein